MSDPNCKWCKGRGVIESPYALERCSCNMPTAEQNKEILRAFQPGKTTAAIAELQARLALCLEALKLAPECLNMPNNNPTKLGCFSYNPRYHGAECIFYRKLRAEVLGEK